MNHNQLPTLREHGDVVRPISQSRSHDSRSNDFLPSITSEKNEDCQNDERSEERDTKSRPDWVNQNTFVRFHRDYYKMDFDPVVTLSNQREFVEGELFDLILLDSWPRSCEANCLMFEIPDKKSEYLNMEEEMDRFYKSIMHRDHFPTKNVQQGHYVVFCEKYKIDNKEVKYKFRRAVLLGPIVPTSSKNAKIPRRYQVKILLIDSGYEFVACCQDLLFLESRFAKLPARAYSFELDGMKFYKNLRMFASIVQPQSGILDGVLHACLVDKRHNCIVIFSEQFPRINYKYGLNGFLIQRMSGILNEPLLPEVGKEREAYIVYVSKDGKVYVQFNTPFYKHYNSLLKNTSDEKINSFKGTVELPLEKSSTIFMAPHFQSNGSYYRCKYLRKKFGNQIEILFIDYGDIATVSLEDVVLADDIHPALSILPRLALKLSLSGVNSMDVASFWKVLPEEKPVILHTSKNTAGSLPEVDIRLYCHIAGDLYRETIVKDVTSNERSMTKLLELVDMSSLRLPEETTIRLIPLEQSFAMNSVGSNYYSPGRSLYLTILSLNSEDGSVLVYPTVVSDRLNKLEIALALEYEKPSRATRAIYTRSWKIGNFFMTYSCVFRSVTRCMLWEMPTVKKLDIEVYLVDYGTLEVVSVETLRTLKEEHCMFPAAGIAATLQIKGKNVSYKVKECEELVHYGAFLGKVTGTKLNDNLPMIEVEVLRAMSDEDVRKDEHRPLL